MLGWEEWGARKMGQAMVALRITDWQSVSASVPAAVNPGSKCIGSSAMSRLLGWSMSDGHGSHLPRSLSSSLPFLCFNPYSLLYARTK